MKSNSRASFLMLAVVVPMLPAQASEELQNWFNDPFFQVSASLPTAQCPPAHSSPRAIVGFKLTVGQKREQPAGSPESASVQTPTHTIKKSHLPSKPLCASAIHSQTPRFGPQSKAVSSTSRVAPHMSLWLPNSKHSLVHFLTSNKQLPSSELIRLHLHHTNFAFPSEPLTSET